ncbi:hypothetical protein EAI_07160, partial [Harpegnathos saltator]
KYFNPNICYICKTIVYNLMTCDYCHLVSYCSQEHKRLHRWQHMQMCLVVEEILNMDAGWDTRQLSREDWIESRKELMHLIKIKLWRNLKIEEINIILFAKSCCICHQQANLQMCIKCCSVNYCNDHVEEFQSVHSSNCYNQYLSFIIEIALINDISSLIKFTLLFDTYEPLIDMCSFIDKHLRKGPYKKLSDCLLSYIYVYSDFVSGPLTLYHGLREMLFHTLNIQDSSYIIHIIYSNYYDKEFFASWELFLHLLNHVQYLTIVILKMSSDTRRYNVNVCSQCRERNRIITIECYSISYYSYVLTNSYKRPNVIIGFQMNLYSNPIWPQIILRLREQNCPLFITFTSQLKAEISL